MSGESYELPLSNIGCEALTNLNTASDGSSNQLSMLTELFTKGDREKVLELMLSNPTVIAQLTAKKANKVQYTASSPAGAEADSPQQPSVPVESDSPDKAPITSTD